MKLNIDDISSSRQKRLTFDFDEKLDIPELAEPDTVHGILTVSINEGGITMTGEVETVLTLNCDVCLRTYSEPLEVEISEQFVYAKPDAHGGGRQVEISDIYTKEKELNPEDFFEVLPADNTLDVSDIVYQAVILGLPAFARCGEACHGVPLKTQNQNTPEESAKIDPRWESLKTLFQNKEN